MYLNIQTAGYNGARTVNKLAFALSELIFCEILHFLNVPTIEKYSENVVFNFVFND